LSNAETTEKLTFEQRVMEQFSLLRERLSKLVDAMDLSGHRMSNIEEAEGQFGPRMSKLEGAVEEYFRETRLAWEQVLKGIMDVKNEVRITGRQLHVLSTRDQIQAADILDLYVRLDRLEPNPNSPTNRLP
jgi:hypothetical protein